uniref:Inositol-pentakisphosphate 2-kinase n=1 Tax=Gallus gallus TaxID=9031 RepID=A0A8V1AAE1_CHICK
MAACAPSALLASFVAAEALSSGGQRIGLKFWLNHPLCGLPGYLYIRSTLQIDGPYNEAFYEKLLDLSTEDDGTIAFALTKVQQYRIAMTAKDCSIMIALSPCLQDECSEQRPVVLASKTRFTFSVSVLDLDLKPYESIPHQYKLDGKIVNYYLKNVQAKDDPVMSSLFKENEDCTLVLHKV